MFRIGSVSGPSTIKVIVMRSWFQLAGSRSDSAAWENGR